VAARSAHRDRPEDPSPPEEDQMLDRRDVGAKPVEKGAELESVRLGVADQGTGARLREHVDELALTVDDVEGDQHRPDLRGSEVRDDPVRRVRRGDRDAVAVAETQTHPAGGDAVRPLVDLGIGDRLATEVDERRCRCCHDPSGERRGNGRPVANSCVHREFRSVVGRTPDDHPSRGP
jgi:hypothetical protein